MGVGRGMIILHIIIIIGFVHTHGGISSNAARATISFLCASWRGVVVLVAFCDDERRRHFGDEESDAWLLGDGAATATLPVFGLPKFT